MPTVTCARCAKEGPQMAFRPFQNDLGLRAYQQICADCWALWLKTQQQLINHYGLNLQEAKAKQFLFEQMEQYLFAGGKQPF